MGIEAQEMKTKSPPKKKSGRKATPPPLVFVDTNILLDFYRFQTDAGPSLLDKLKQLRGRLIMTYQVEMEFKKNRQTVMLNSLSGLKNPDGAIQVPRFLSDTKAVQGINTNRDKIAKQVSKLHSQLDNALRNPLQNDSVYASLQHFFRSEDELNLGRDKPSRFEIRRLARKRWLLGYPPRKSNDTSIGDAVNWEWIIRCASNCTAGVIIISRDSDFGVTHRGESFLNDWLNQEFHSRVAQGRPISLYARLTEGLKAASIQPTPAEITAEEEVSSSRPSADTEPNSQSPNLPSDSITNAILQYVIAARKLRNTPPESAG